MAFWGRGGTRTTWPFTQSQGSRSHADIHQMVVPAWHGQRAPAEERCRQAQQVAWRWATGSRGNGGTAGDADWRRAWENNNPCLIPSSVSVFNFQQMHDVNRAPIQQVWYTVSAVRSKWTLFYLGMIDVSVSQGSKANGKRKLKSGALYTGLLACQFLRVGVWWGNLFLDTCFVLSCLLLIFFCCLWFSDSCLLCWENKTDLTGLRWFYVVSRWFVCWF